MTRLSTLTCNLREANMNVFKDAFRDSSFPSITTLFLCCPKFYFVARHCPSILNLEAPFSHLCQPQAWRRAYSLVSAVSGKDLRSLSLWGRWTTDLTEGDRLPYYARSAQLIQTGSFTEIFQATPGLETLNMSGVNYTDSIFVSSNSPPPSPHALIQPHLQRNISQS